MSKFWKIYLKMYGGNQDSFFWVDERPFKQNFPKGKQKNGMNTALAYQKPFRNS